MVMPLPVSYEQAAVGRAAGDAFTDAPPCATGSMAKRALQDHWRRAADAQAATPSTPVLKTYHVRLLSAETAGRRLRF